MAEAKTRESQQNVAEFIASVENEARRTDALELQAMMEKVTRRPARMWGTSIVGFGAYTATYASGREAEWLLTGFSPRKSAVVVYIMDGFSRHEDAMSRLGKYKTGKSCLYLKRLADVDSKALAGLIRTSVAHMRKTYPTR